MKRIKRIFKHFTLVNITVAVFSLFFVALIRYSGLPVWILENILYINNPQDIYIYLLSGFLGIIIRLGIRAVIEEGFFDGNELFPQHMTASQDNPNLNPWNLNESSPSQPPQGNQPPQSVDQNSNSSYLEPWRSHNYDGDGFKVRNGRLSIDCTSEVRFYDKNNLPNKSNEIRIMAENIANAFEYKYNYTRKMNRVTNLNGSAHTWFKDYLRYTYPNRHPSNYINNGVLREELRNFARN